MRFVVASVMNVLLLSLQGWARRRPSDKAQPANAKPEDMQTNAPVGDDRALSDPEADCREGVWVQGIANAGCERHADGISIARRGPVRELIKSFRGLPPTVRRLPLAARRLPSPAKTCHGLPATASCEREVFDRGTRVVTTARAGWRDDVLTGSEVRAGEINQRLSVGSRRERSIDWKNGARPQRRPVTVCHIGHVVESLARRGLNAGL